MLRFVDVPIVSGGAVSCARCRRPEPTAHRPAAEVLAEVRDAVAAWGEVSGPNVSLAGADPFGHPALADLLEGAVSAGVRRLRLDVGCGVSAPSQAAETVAKGVRVLRVTVLGDPEVHDALAGASGSAGSVREAVTAFRAAADVAGVKAAVTARVPVCPHNLQAAPEAVVEAARLGATSVELEASAALGRSAVPWLLAACDTGTVNAVWVSLAGLSEDAVPDSHRLHLVSTVEPRLPEGAEAC